MLTKLRSETLILELLVPVIAVILSFLVGAIFILAIGSNPILVYGQMFGECFGTGYGFAQVLQKTTQLIFTGLAVALAFRVGLFNIGASACSITYPPLHSRSFNRRCTLGRYSRPPESILWRA